MTSLLVSASFLCLTPVSAQDDKVILGDYACGITSLYLVCKIQGVPVTWDEVRALMGPPAEDGTHSFADIARSANSLGLRSLGMKADYASLKNFPFPAILHVRDIRKSSQPPHLLVILGVRGNRAVLLDPPMPSYYMPQDDLARIWDGNILVFPRGAVEERNLEAPYEEYMVRLILIGAECLALAGLAALLIRCQYHSRSCLSVNRLASRLWSWKVGIIVLSVASFMIVMQLVSRHPLPPRCSFDAPVIDLGELPDAEHNVDVFITNNGGMPLTLGRASSSCSCAATTVPKEIGSGQRTAIRVALKVAPGPQRAALFVESNDPEGDKSVLLVWRGQAVPRLMPSRIVAPRVGSHQAWETSVKVVYPSGGHARVPKLERVECDYSGVKVSEGHNNLRAIYYSTSITPTNTLGELNLNVSVIPDNIRKTINTVCRLHFRYGSGTQTLSLPIAISFSGGEWVPDVSGVVFAADAANDLVGQEREVIVTHAGDGADLVSPESMPWLKTTVERLDGHRYRMRFVVTEVPRGLPLVHTIELSRPGARNGYTPLPIYVYISR